MDLKLKAQQTGFMMPLALFIVVGLAALALAISRFSSATFNASVTEALAVQALYVAESGGQVGIHSVTFDAPNSGAADSRCTALNGQALQFNAAGASGCSSQLNCERVNVSGGERIYLIESTARCGGGDLSVTRRITYTTVL